MNPGTAPDVVTTRPRPGLAGPGERLLVLDTSWDPSHGAAGAGAVRVDNVWDDRRRIWEAEAECWRLVEKVATRLAPRLNALHGRDHTLRYWRVLVLPWLMHACHVLKDRYELVRLAGEMAPGAPFRRGWPAPMTVHDDPTRWHRGTWTDPWNDACFAFLFRAMGGEVQAGTDAPEQAERVETGGAGMRGVRAGVRWGVDRVLGARARGGARVLLAATNHLSSLTLARFRGVPGVTGTVGSRWVAPTGLRIDWEARRGLFDPGDAPGFERILLQALPHCVPASLVEAYPHVARTSLERYGARPRHCVVASMDALPPPLAEYAARAVESGSRLVTVQHGGGYGAFALRSLERLDRALADEFWSWGGLDRCAELDVRVLPNRHLSRIKDTARGGSSLVLVNVSFPRYTYRFMSCPLGGQVARHQRFVARFAATLPTEIRSRIRYRPYPVDFGWEGDPVGEALDGGMAEGGGKAWEAIQTSAAALICYPDTTFIEAMCIGTPTVGVWPAELWEMRPSAIPVFQALEEAGIVYHDPDAAAEHVARVGSSFHAWWATPRVREARDMFLRRFAASGSGWWEAWARELKRLKAQGRAGE